MNMYEAIKEMSPEEMAIHHIQFAITTMLAVNGSYPEALLQDDIKNCVLNSLLAEFKEEEGEK